MKRLRDLLILLILINYVKSESSDNPCNNQENCSECISNPACSWCSQSDFHGADKKQQPRCNTTIGHNLGRFKCNPEFLFHPDSNISIIRNNDFTTGKNPIKPQEIRVELRQREPYKFNLTYNVKEDFPIDLYYLMDLTLTMKDDKKSISILGETLANNLTSITSQFRHGFGSFIDKVAMPFVMMKPANLLNPCKKDACVRPYGFKNHLKLSSAVGALKIAMSEAPLSASVDAPEGGFDALMQTMVCTDDIGWTPRARRLVLFLTDAPFHIAGDGKLGGIIRPNDGKCHLKDNEYTHSTIMDYPSIAHINHEAIQKSINVIFAVTEDQYPVYQLLEEWIEGAKVAKLSNDSSNIVTLVKQQYEAITSEVVMSHTFPKEFVQVNFFSNCGKEAEERPTAKCINLTVGKTVNFTVTLELLKCPEDRNEWDRTYRIYRVGLEDSLSINLKMLCDCPCDDKKTWIYNSPMCSNNGTQKCGICDCNKNHSGKNCQCYAGSDLPDGDDPNEACKKGNSKEYCSGRGQCECGKCINCDEEFTGEFCDCENFSCPKYDGYLCGGTGKGVCKCGTCECFSGWNDTDCHCSTETNNCIAPSESIFCSGQGECKCGRCECFGKYSGQYCEKCKHESCPTKCEELKPCILCKVHGTGPYGTSDCDPNCKDSPINIVDVVTIDEENKVACRGVDTDKCSYYFSYGQNADKTIYINAQRTKECPPEAPTFWIMIGIISLIVVIGLGLILFWKIYTLIQDRREYAHFQEEAKNAEFSRGTNPLYNDPIGNYQNPAYGKNQ